MTFRLWRCFFTCVRCFFVRVQVCHAGVPHLSPTKPPRIAFPETRSYVSQVRPWIFAEGASQNI